jgi:outer membrane protein TolC
MKFRKWIHVVSASAALVCAGCQQAPRVHESVRSAGTTPRAEVVAEEPTTVDAKRDSHIAPVSFDSPLTTAVSSAEAALPVPQDIVAPVPSNPQDLQATGNASSESPFLEEIPAPRGVDRNQILQLDQVVESVHQSYPLLRIAFLERGIADGNQLAAWGEFDTGVKIFGIETPQGYYENYRQGVVVTQPTYQGGYVFGGYKIGRGDFQPWFKDRQTNDGGEFALGAGVPLLKDRAIDKRRSELFQAEISRQAVEPAIQTELLDYVRVASQIYWSWVASGQVVDARRELLRLARARVDQISARVAAGDLGEIARINNEQLIAARETKLIESERKLQMVAIKLSLFYRTPQGNPVVPGTRQLPPQFPHHAELPDQQVTRDIDQALATRPELVELELQFQKTTVALQQAENQLLPKLDALVMASKDVGASAERIDNKGPLELEAGLYGEVPLQRREAKGKIETTRAKLAQIRAKREFAANKITAEVQDAVSALRAAEARTNRAGINLQLADETLDMARAQFDEGDIDLVELNIYEQAVLDGRILLIEAQVDYFIARADYYAALGIDPLPSSR